MIIDYHLDTTPVFLYSLGWGVFLSKRNAASGKLWLSDDCTLGYHVDIPHGREVGAGLGRTDTYSTRRLFDTLDAFNNHASPACDGLEPKDGDFFDISPDKKHIRDFDDRSGLWMGGWDGPGT
ncbi:hypothetical protein AO1008_11674 [Aspergillus oryzae 100-8]|uniref:Uncharacterized protein n=1 Tax=Aspergillus oryzae (strain 3.042) TaxID=1160506 RepID=I8A5X0_ASPO3|nr:hypothetical protein Ao3042_03522 [Aspergillus oryzae 3.042]KDE75336.1 hypothetical protein AO1008_11674 [Aspergillus oryzae 100-8]|eukprot:EIT80024.1 hypothetical protein Ao3042_03522 [Aspergillus oryzae 3.042]